MSATETSPGVKLVPHRQKFALVLDPELPREVGIDENTLVSVTTDGHSLVVRRATSADLQKKFDQAKEDTFRKYDATLKRLAE